MDVANLVVAIVSLVVGIGLGVGTFVGGQVYSDRAARRDRNRDLLIALQDEFDDYAEAALEAAVRRRTGMLDPDTFSRSHVRLAKLVTRLHDEQIGLGLVGPQSKAIQGLVELVTNSMPDEEYVAIVDTIVELSIEVVTKLGDAIRK
jgi:hypothetical protein